MDMEASTNSLHISVFFSSLFISACFLFCSIRIIEFESVLHIQMWPMIMPVAYLYNCLLAAIHFNRTTITTLY